MFRIRADFREDVEMGAGLSRARLFFADAQNFARLMPGLESIREEAPGAARWTIGASVPIVGTMRGEFRLARADDHPTRLEWSPVLDEKKNLLRYAIAFEEISSERTLVRFALRLELRRERAAELHLMAALMGSVRISALVQERVNHVVKTFLDRARAEIEGKV